MIKIKQLCRDAYYHLVYASQHSLEWNIKHFKLGGYVVAILYTIFYLSNTYVFHYDDEELSLRVIGVIFGLAMANYHRWPAFLKKHAAKFWISGVIFILPFHFVFMILKTNFDITWLTGTIIMLFFSLIVLGDFLLVLASLIVGIVSAVLVYIFLFEGQFFLAKRELIIYGVLLFFALSVGYLYLRLIKKSLGHKERLEGMMSVMSTIAHELRTPLLSVKSGATGMQRYLPVLLECYEYACKNRTDIPVIRINHIEQLQSVLDRIGVEVDYSNNIIDMMLINAKGGLINTADFEDCSIVHCVETALMRYSYKPGQKDVVNWDCHQDFHFLGNEIMVVHILFNLLKNAYYFIQCAEKGKIYIWVESTEKNNTLHFKDTGAGIPENVLPRIFDWFYSTTRIGIGVGLAFCRDIMHKLGGNIECSSKEGEYTEFILIFPKIEFMNAIIKNQAGELEPGEVETIRTSLDP